MGYQHGVGCEVIDTIRTGYCLNLSPDAMDPTFFSYSLDDPPLVESWGQGLVVLHNPNCLHPVPKDFFVHAAQGSVDGNVIMMEVRNWHPFSSKTLIFYFGESKKKLAEALPHRKPRLAVGAITKEEFHAAWGFEEPNAIGEEHGWFSDEAGAFLGVVIRDKFDDDWGYAVLARDQYFRFRAIECKVSLATRYQARIELQLKMAELLSSPQRIFPQ